MEWVEGGGGCCSALAESSVHSMPVPRLGSECTRDKRTIFFHSWYSSTNEENN